METVRKTSIQQKVHKTTQNTQKKSMPRTFHLTFNKESDGAWYIDFPGYPFSHHNLMMVSGADYLCDYVAKKEGHPLKAVVDVTLGDNTLEGKRPVITMERYDVGYGASYNCFDSLGCTPGVDIEGRSVDIPTAWLCPVTLLVLFQYPSKINIFIPDGERGN